VIKIAEDSFFEGKQYIYAVYREKSFSRAAEKLFISQPSLSANVKRVEERIGYQIFDRSTKPLSLTECGKKYIEAVEKIRKTENDFGNFVSDWGELKTGHLSLGGSSLFSSWVLPPIMGKFMRRYPNVNVELTEESTKKLEILLLNGLVDLIMDNCDLSQSLYGRMLYREEHLLLAVPASLSQTGIPDDAEIHAKNIRDGSFLSPGIPAVDLTLFRKYPFLLLKPDNDTGRRAAAMLRERGMKPQIIFQLDQQLTSYNITLSGMGISFISDTLVSRVPDSRSVRFYKLSSRYSVRNLCFYWKSDRYLSRSMEEFLKLAGQKDEKRK